MLRRPRLATYVHEAGDVNVNTDGIQIIDVGGFFGSTNAFGFGVDVSSGSAEGPDPIVVGSWAVTAPAAAGAAPGATPDGTGEVFGD